MIDITVIGFGNVGSTLALLLLSNKHDIRLNVMDPKEGCKGAFLDLAHSVSEYANKELIINNEELFQTADFIFYTAGSVNAHGSSRLSIMKDNVALSKEIFESKSFVKKPYIIVITNPVDIVSLAIQDYSDLPANRVIGTGTMLDSRRLAHYLSLISNDKPSDFRAIVLGEHGATQVPVFSNTLLRGQPILEDDNFTTKDLELVLKQTVNAANTIRETQPATFYGVAACAADLFNYLLEENKQLITLSVLTNEYYKNLLNLDKDIYIGLPVIVQKGGFEIDNSIVLNEEELAAFQVSAAMIAKSIAI